MVKGRKRREEVWEGKQVEGRVRGKKRKAGRKTEPKKNEVKEEEEKGQ